MSSNRLDAALAIEGWMNRAELAWLEAMALTHPRIVEFGAFKGRSTKVLAACSGFVYTVDWWNGDMETRILPEFMRNLAEEILVGPKVVPHRMSTDEFGRLMSVKADMVFIDASHDYESVKKDIRTARGILAPGGLLAGHDFSNDWPGVQQAVQELVPGYQRVPGGDIWYEVQA